MTTESQKQKEKESEAVAIITLKYPFKFGEKNITQCIFMHRPKAKDLKGLDLSSGRAEEQCKLLGRVTDLSTPEIEELDLEDFAIVGKKLATFLPDSLKDGKVV